MRFVDHLVGQASSGAGVLDVGQSLGQHGERTDRRLQLVADVGDEVGTHRVETGPFADIVDGHQRTAVLEGHRVDRQDGARRSDELDGLTAGVATHGPPHMAFDRFFHEHRSMPVIRARGNVLHPGLPGRIGQHDPDRQRVQRTTEV